jgi:sugar lactone lactonase YvrE
MSVLRLASTVFMSCLVFLSANAAAWERGSVQSFASLPPGSPNPEGITADSRGNIYVSGFGPTTPQGATGPGYVFVFGQNGKLLRTLRPAISSNALLGLAFHPDGDLLVVDFGQSQVLRVDPRNGNASVFMTVPALVPPAAHGLNDITLDRAGNVYVSDSFQGTIWTTGPAGGPATPWKTDELLTTTGFPPFGANGLQFNSDESALFVANTGNDTVVRIGNDAAREATVFTHAINGADGLFIDEHDNVWVCANQADELVVVDPSGKAIAKLGDFEGVRHGSPVGFLFPASLVRVDGWIYVTNLSLDLRAFGGQTVDSQWAAQVTTHTISRIRARVPR